MKQLRNLFFALVIAAATAPVTQVAAEAYSNDCDGCGYERSQGCTSLTPAIAVGSLAAAAIIAVLIQNHSGSDGHCHSGHAV